MTRQLDHLVLPVENLAVARHRLTELGFTVAPDGQHPFGTGNCCVYFSDNTFIEPLAITDEEHAAAAIRSGNVFVARDHVFRSIIGQEGVSAIVLATEDASEDFRQFADAGIGLGEMLTFSRPFIDAAGNSDNATFRLAFAGSPDIADAFVFSCERVNAPKVDRSALTGHANGALSLSRVLIAPGATHYLDLVAVASSAGRGAVKLGNTAVAADELARSGNAATINAIAFRVADLHIVENLLQRTAIDFQRWQNQIIVPPARGQGVDFIFEAIE